MAQWKGVNNANSHPKYVASSLGLGSGKTNEAANNTALFNNTSVGAFVGGKSVGVVGVETAAKANTGGEASRVAHPGWALRTVGTGPVVSFTVAAGGTGYSNTDVVRASGGTVNATSTVTTNSTGGIVSVGSPSPVGSGFINAANTTVAVANSTGGASAGSGATVTVNLGGRAGRVHYETLVAMGTIAANSGSNTSYLPK